MKAHPVNTVNVDKSKRDRYILVDPQFNKPGRVDISIGADLYALILQTGVVKIDGVLGLKTNFRWIVSGCKKSKGKEAIVATAIELKDIIRYLEVEEEHKNYVESELCENNFTRTTRKDSGGQ